LRSNDVAVKRWAKFIFIVLINSLFLEDLMYLPRNVHRKLVGDVHVCSGLEHLRIIHLRYDRLIFARQILVERFNQLLASELCLLFFFF
jgi:hypothetical protein